MAVELNDEDRAAIATIVDETSTESIYLAGIRAGLERAAKHAGQLWRDGYRGEVNAGFEHSIRALAKP